MDIGLLRVLPKVELHLHLVGAISGPALTALLSGVRDSVAECLALGGEESAWEFRDFPHFCETFGRVSRLLTKPEDIVAVIDHVVERLIDQQIRYAEVTVTPLAHVAAGIAADELAGALDVGRRSAHGRGVELGWVYDFSGEEGAEAGQTTLDWVQRWGPANTVAFGVGGPEDPPRRGFAEVFSRAHAMGLGCVPHAGESTCAQEVSDALEFLHADRIGHGICAAHDPKALARLVRTGVALEVCPTSNMQTGCCARVEEHPLAGLLSAGVRCTIGSDDPGFFGSDLVGELWLCQARLGLDEAQILQLLETGIEVSFASAALKQELREALWWQWERGVPSPG